jgi:hypothetical protein
VPPGELVPALVVGACGAAVGGEPFVGAEEGADGWGVDGEDDGELRGGELVGSGEGGGWCGVRWRGGMGRGIRGVQSRCWPIGCSRRWWSRLRGLNGRWRRLCRVSRMRGRRRWRFSCWIVCEYLSCGVEVEGGGIRWGGGRA